MDPDTFRSGVDVEGSDVYWRRRVSVLTGVLVVVAFVAWACTSATGKPRKAANPEKSDSDAAVISLPSDVMSTMSPSADPAASKSPGAEASPETPGPSVSPSAVPSPAPSPTPSPTATVRPSDPPATPRPGGRCIFDDLVLSLRGGQTVYSSTARPTFLLTMVNTGDVECTADMGPRTLETRITSGRDRIWSTADCVSGSGVNMQLLKRGIPYVRMIQWDRHRSGYDCSAQGDLARPGTYVVTAYAGPLKSAKVVFQLR